MNAVGNTTSDARLLIATRCLRMFSYAPLSSCWPYAWSKSVRVSGKSDSHSRSRT